MHPIAAAFDDYWNALRKGADIPRFIDFNINHVPARALPFMSLMQVEERPRRFRYRLAGTSVVAAYGKDLTGVYLDELDTGGRYEEYVHNFNQTVDERVINRRRDEYTLADGSVYRFDGNLYPFEGVHGSVSRIIVLAIDSLAPED